MITFVFLNPETKKPLTRIQRSFKTACKNADIEGLRLQDLRHSFATRLVKKGFDIETVRDLLEHYSVTVTQRYTNSTDERKKEAVEALSKKAEVSDKMVTEENQSKLIH